MFSSLISPLDIMNHNNSETEPNNNALLENYKRRRAAQALLNLKASAAHPNAVSAAANMRALRASRGTRNATRGHKHHAHPGHRGHKGGAKRKTRRAVDHKPPRRR